jgi:Na+/melibiose symporter-like transporter
VTEQEHSFCQNLELLQRLLLLTLTGGFLIMLLEIRFQHSVVMGEKWQSWIPVIYLMTLLVLVPLGMIFFRRFGRNLLIILFSGLAMIGIFGFWFHSKNKPVQAVLHVIATDLAQPGHIKISNEDEETNPPLLAPLSLAGLGTIGVLASLLTNKQDKNAEQ